MKNIFTLVLLTLLIFSSLLSCEAPADIISIKDNENREFFKKILREENVKFSLANETGKEIIVLERDQSKKARELLNKYSGESIQPGLSVCYNEKNMINIEANKLKSEGIKHDVVRAYAFYCITWDKNDDDKVRSIIK